ncbi:MAG: hypothetical protein E5299_01564 [Burkholderia gladioli]|nr:MAG: hypothetical protein E5299_01564 [Burkholderia gladioli]
MAKVNRRCASTTTRSGERCKVHLALNANTGQVHAALMMNRSVTVSYILMRHY